jgi:glycerophosphoryl diester phosphodiesterase
MKPLVIARCGDSECFPENTLPAFESAIQKGADGIEFDVHQTSDGHLIVHHFYNLGGSDNGTGLVHEHTLAELRALDSGSWFSPKFAGLQKPTLAEVLELCKVKVRLELEVKSSSLAVLEQIVKTLEEFNVIDQTELTTAHLPLLFHARKLKPTLSTGTFFYPSPEWMPLRLSQSHVLDWAKQLDIQKVHLDSKLLGTEFVQRLHQENLSVHASNLDFESAVEHGLLFDLDGFSTGHLSMALNVLARNDGRHN